MERYVYFSIIVDDEIHRNNVLCWATQPLSQSWNQSLNLGLLVPRPGVYTNYL